jgi:hypothetical protein
MVDEDEVELLITAVVSAEDEDTATSACEDLVDKFAGRVVATTDCSDEEPGCWAVTIRVDSGERAHGNAAKVLPRVVRRFVRALGPHVLVPKVACEPPTAWTVLDDPDLVDTLVPGGDRLLIEAWCGSDFRGLAAKSSKAKPAVAGTRLRLRVDVVADRVADQAASAEWQARAVAGRIVRASTITGISELNGVLSVDVDLGATDADPGEVVSAAMAAIDWPGWSKVSRKGDTAHSRWVAAPRPPSGITALELRSGPG